MQISKEVKVGFVAIVAMALLVWGYNYLKGTNILFKSKSVYAIYPKVPGLAVSAPIIINGVQSGVVDAIYFHKDKSSRVIVRLNITESELSIPNNSIAELISVDFMGSKAIGIKLGDSSENIESGDTLQNDFEISMLEDFSEQMLPIKEKAENMMDSLKIATASFKKLADNMNDIFDEKRKRDLKSAMSKFKTTMERFEDLARSMDRFFKNDMKVTLIKYNSVADTIKNWDVNNTLFKAQTTLDTMTLILNKMNNGEGTMGQLMTNDSLYNNLNAATKEMEELLEDIKLHPKRYFRVLSKKEIPYKKKDN